jgi:hypothetical protein
LPRSAARLQRRTGSARTSLGPIKYEKIFNGTVSEKLKVAQKFKENFDERN